MTELEQLLPWILGAAAGAGFFFGRFVQVRRDRRRYRRLEAIAIELREQVSLQQLELEQLRMVVGGAEHMQSDGLLLPTSPPPPPGPFSKVRA